MRQIECFLSLVRCNVIYNSCIRFSWSPRFWTPLFSLLSLLLLIPSHRPLHHIDILTSKLATPKLAYLRRACTPRVAPSKLTSTFTCKHWKVVVHCCITPPPLSLTAQHNTTTNMAHTAAAQDNPHEVPKRPRGMPALQKASIDDVKPPTYAPLHRHPQELELLPANLSRRSHLAHE